MGNWEENVRKVVPYVPGEQPNKAHMIKLNIKAWEELDMEKLRLYPDPACGILVEAVAETYGVKPDQVFTGVGSDDVLAMIFLTFFNSKKPILFPDITYSFYDVWADMLRIPYEVQPLD